MAVQPGLCQNWSESTLLVFSRRGPFNFVYKRCSKLAKHNDIIGFILLELCFIFPSYSIALWYTCTYFFFHVFLFIFLNKIHEFISLNDKSLIIEPDEPEILELAIKVATWAYLAARRQRQHTNDSSYWRRHCCNIVGTQVLLSGNMSAGS